MIIEIPLEWRAVVYRRIKIHYSFCTIDFYFHFDFTIRTRIIFENRLSYVVMNKSKSTVVINRGSAS